MSDLAADTATQSTNALDNIHNWQQFQTIYHKITGKKEQIRKYYSEPYQINFKDIEDLHFKILQAAEPYPIAAHNESVTLVYIDDSNPVLSSFQKFKIQSSAGNTPIKSITLEYNIAIKATQSNDINSYTIKVDIASGIAIFSEIKKEVPKFVWRDLGFRTGKCTVEYVDYAIAQNFINVINAWFEGRGQAPKRKILDWVQSKSQYIPRICRSLLFIACIIGIYKAVDTQLFILTGFAEIAKFMLYASATVFSFMEIGWFLGKAIESSVDEIWKISYVRLNDGDDRLIKEVQDANQSCALNTAYQLLVFLLLTIVSVLIKDGLHFFMSKFLF